MKKHPDQKMLMPEQTKASKVFSGHTVQSLLQEGWIASAAIASSISPIAFVDSTDSIAYVNTAFLSIWGYTHEDRVVGKKASDFWDLQAIHDRKLRDKGGWIGELTAYHNDGRSFPVQASATMLIDGQGAGAFRMVSFNDISDRVNAQCEQRRLLGELQERVKELACLYSILSIPHSCESSLEEVPQRIVSAIPTSLQWPEAAHARIVIGSLQVSTPGYVKTATSLSIPLFTNKDGFLEVCYDEDRETVSRAPFLDAERDLLLAAAREIARIIEQRNTQEELRTNREKLLHSDKMASIGVLSTEIMHEIGNPNNFIAINTRILTRAFNDILPILTTYYRENGNFSMAGLPYSDARLEIPRLLGAIAEGSERIKEIGSRLKTLARDSVPSPHQNLRLNEAVRSAVEFTRDIIRNGTSRFDQILDESDPVVCGNSRHLQQVVINLITNACQALTDRSQRITVRSEVQEKNRTVCVSVEDEGCGIRPDDLSRVMDPFYSTKRDRGNTGLGLSISNDIALRHGGKLIIESTPGRGTCARLQLPAGSKSGEPS